MCQHDSNLAVLFLSSRSNLLSLLRHLRSAFELVPVEGASVNGALQRLEKHERENLPVRETLQPDVEEQPAIAFVCRVTPFEGEGQDRRDEVDEQEGEEVNQQPRKAIFRAAEPVEADNPETTPPPKKVPGE